jgi:predicted RNase H-like nuclease (RuvC/YqgF family)
MGNMVKCRVTARNLFQKPDGKHSNRLRECEIGEELSYKEGAMPPAWTGKVEVIDGKRKPNAVDEQAALIEKLTAELAEKDQALEKLTAELAEKDQALEKLTAELDEKDQALEKLTAELAEKDQALEKLTAELDELTKPVAPKKLENATK